MIQHNLPAQPTPFIGRTHELTALDTYLAERTHRLITITGPGGMGKTRLALACGERQVRNLITPFTDGVFFIPLAPLNDPSRIVSTTADLLGLTLQGEGINQLSPSQQLCHYLRQRQLLLIMDNFEHIVSGAQLLVEILAAAPNVQMIVTSRERLNLSQEQVYPIHGLEFPQTTSNTDAYLLTAVQLFQQSARRNDPHFNITADDLPHLARICHLVQGTPLGIELAASWVDMLPLAEIAQEIEQNLDFLETEKFGVTERHRSMRAVFDYSWQLLSDEERAILPKLSVFGSGFTRQAAQAIVGANLRQLSRLVAKSLLQYDKPNDRYHLHELLRQYSAEKLAQHDNAERVALAHAQHYMQMLVNQWDYFAGFSSLEQLQTIAADLDNIRQAWQFAVTHKLVDLFAYVGGTVMGFFGSSGLDLEGAALTRQALAALPLPPTGDTAVELRLAHAWLHVANDRPRAEQLHLETAVLTEQRPPDQLLAVVYGYTALQYWIVGDFTQAHHWGEKMRQIATALGDEPATYYAQYLITTAQTQLGAWEEDVREQLETVAAYFQQHYPRAIWLSWIYYSLSNWRRAHGALDLACHAIEQGLAVVQYWGLLYPIGQGYVNLIQIYHQQDNDEQARRYLREYLTWYQTRGQTWQMLDSLVESVRNFPNLIGDAPLMVSLLAMVITHPDTIPHGKLAAQTAVDHIRPQLDPAAYHTAWERGEGWNLTTAVTHLLTALSPPLNADLPSLLAEPTSTISMVRFQQQELLATGGHGEVYRGIDTFTNEPIVIKRLRKELIAQQPEMLARFLREADVLRHLNHPNIVKLLATQETEAGQTIVMEYIPGGSLDDLLKREKQLPFTQLLDIGLELADALARAHHLGVIHRDIKPANVLLATDGTPRLTDFGIASLKQSNIRLTQTGVIIGTINYMSPEACEGQQLDVRSDIWSFGAMLYQMVAGAPPFAADSMISTVMAILAQSMPNLLEKRPLTPPPLILLIEQMLVKDPSRRLSSMRQVAADLEKLRTQLPSASIQ